MTNQPHTTFPSKKAAADHQKRMAALAAKNEEEKRILADRYKTKMCKNYVANGECPYEVRCMFAHGEEELRTSEDNIRDGLVTEEAIKTFQRQQNQAKRRMAYAAAREAEQRAASHQHHHHRQQQQQQQQEEEQQQMDLYMDGEAESEVMYYGHPHASMHAPRMVPHALATEHRAGYYVHNPYAFNIIPAASREFVMYEEPMPVMEGEEAAGYWYEEQMPAMEGEEDYYFPSSEMMMAQQQQQQQPLVPSIVASAQQQRPRHFKLYDSVPSSSLSEEGPAYAYQQQGESADDAPHAKATHCVAADLPDFEQEAPMVLEP